LFNFPEAPLPFGYTYAQLKKLLQSIEIDNSGPGTLDPYVEDSFERFLFTWDLAKDLQGSCLELGANPYFTTLLLKEFSSLDVKLANYFGGDSKSGSQTLTWNQNNKMRSKELKFDHFNLEEGSFPYPDSSFDVILFCEILEHLLMDPLHCLREINRCLKPNGVLITTTPNVARLGNVFAIIDGASIYDPYSGFGPYGRHNREYSLSELSRLLQFAGFNPTSAFTANSHADNLTSRSDYERICQMVAHRPNDLGQYLFTCSKKIGEPKAGLPTFLYRSWPEEQMNHEG
jgi:SAM-dependent methyltransferase